MIMIDINDNADNIARMIEDVDATLLLGEVHRAKGEMDKAIEELKSARGLGVQLIRISKVEAPDRYPELRAKAAGICYNLGTFCMDRHIDDDAKSAFEQALKIDDGHVKVHHESASIICVVQLSSCVLVC
jgi:hypothetical protein